MLLASSKFPLTLFCLVCTFLLYTYDHSSAPSNGDADAPSNTSEAIVFDARVQFSDQPPAPVDSAPNTVYRSSNVSKERRPRILQATMMFGNTFTGLNERILQSHVDHATRWGYRDHVLRREIVGVGQWDKFIFSKVLHVLDLIVEELKKPRAERAEWVVWYDADTLILNPNVHWELFLPNDAFPDIYFMATKNVDGFNAGLCFFRINEWSVDLLSDAYSLSRLRPEINISGNVEQNALQYLFDLERNKKHILYQPQLWYNGFKGANRAETEINGGDMLVHFAGVNHASEGQKKDQLMSLWLAKVEEQPDKWHVPLEKTKYPREIEAFWNTYRESKKALYAVRVRSDIQLGPYQDVRSARDNLKWAIEESAYDIAYLKSCLKDLARALKAAEKPQVTAGSGGHADEQAPRNDGQDASGNGRVGQFSGT